MGKLEESALTAEEVQGEVVTIKYLPLSVAAERLEGLLWGKNAKRHDAGGLWQSIKRYGFIDPPKFDRSLNGGKGGIGVTGDGGAGGAGGAASTFGQGNDSQAGNGGDGGATTDGTGGRGGDGGNCSGKKFVR
jgi:hypothetical protein